MDSETKKKIISIVNCFEMGTPHIQYDQITILNDGPNKVKQFTGSFGVTEAYNLKPLIELYIQKEGKFSQEFKRYLPNMGKKFVLADDKSFHALWKKSAKEDALMREAQDEIYERIYFVPAEKWSETAKFVEPLSYLVIFDSILQSGSILTSLRNKFPEKLPNNGGDEKAWIKSYVTVRNSWLSNHSNKAVRNSSYRTRDLLRIINNNDWDLEKPVKANDIIVP